MLIAPKPACNKKQLYLNKGNNLIQRKKMKKTSVSAEVDPWRTCPFWGRSSPGCTISAHSQGLGSMRGNDRCISDDHDSCPLFLSRALLSSRSGSGRSNLDFFHK